MTEERSGYKIAKTERKPVSLDLADGPSLIEKLYKDGQVPAHIKTTLDSMYAYELSKTSLDIAITAELCLSDTFSARRLNLFLTYLERLTDKNCTSVIKEAW